MKDNIMSETTQDHYDGRPNQAKSSEKCPDCKLIMMFSKKGNNTYMYCPDIKCGYSYTK